MFSNTFKWFNTFNISLFETWHGNRRNVVVCVLPTVITGCLLVIVGLSMETETVHQINDLSRMVCNRRNLERILPYKLYQTFCIQDEMRIKSPALFYSTGCIFSLLAMFFCTSDNLTISALISDELAGLKLSKNKWQKWRWPVRVFVRILSAMMSFLKKRSPEVLVSISQRLEGKLFPQR